MKQYAKTSWLSLVLSYIHLVNFKFNNFLIFYRWGYCSTCKVYDLLFSITMNFYQPLLILLFNPIRGTKFYNVQLVVQNTLSIFKYTTKHTDYSIEIYLKGMFTSKTVTVNPIFFKGTISGSISGCSVHTALKNFLCFYIHNSFISIRS